MRSLAVACVAWALAALVLLVARTAQAHTVGLSHGDYALDGAVVHGKITLRSEDLARAVPRADADGDGAISESELGDPRLATTLREAITAKITARAGGATCSASTPLLHPDGTDGVAFVLDWTCPAAGSVTLDLGFLALLPSGHRHLASISSGGITRDELVVLAEPTITVGDAAPSAATGVFDLVNDGVIHILTGADHLAFLVGVILSFAAVGGNGPSGRRRLAPVAWMLTAFTVGHSAALATATIGGFAPPFVEPAVALSVAYIGLENAAGFRLRPRALVTLAFGFVHGFAYASGLLPLGIPRERLPVAVLSFNVGVELGQLAVVAIVLPLVILAEKHPRFPLARRVLAIGLIAAGIVWFGLRLVAP